MPRTEVTSFGRTVVVMDMRRLGNSGLTVSVVGLGGNNLGRAGTATETADGAAAVVNAAVDAGITLFDTADCYGKTWVKASPSRGRTYVCSRRTRGGCCRPRRAATF
jgi:aryl-alcohol dehydrogenase-like predicted oxidoreductase